MAIVTRVDPTGPRGNQSLVHLDDERWTAMPRRWAARRGIEPGRVVPVDERDAIEAELADRVGRFLCQASLGRGARSRAELEQRLVRYGLAPCVIERTIASIEAAGLTDDDELAASVARSLRRRGYGESRIRQTLRRRGLGDAGHEPEPESRDEAVARAVAALGRRHPDAPARAIGFLARRGFPADVCRRAVADRPPPRD